MQRMKRINFSKEQFRRPHLPFGVSSCREHAAWIIHISPELRCPCQQSKTSLSPPLLCHCRLFALIIVKKSASKTFCCENPGLCLLSSLMAFSSSLQQWGQSGSAQSAHRPESLSENKLQHTQKGCSPKAWAITVTSP